ncbi:MAG: hypothetical protein ACLR8Y_10745 [Alistipes indistinctus]
MAKIFHASGGKTAKEVYLELTPDNTLRRMAIADRAASAGAICNVSWSKAFGRPSLSPSCRTILSCTTKGCDPRIYLPGRNRSARTERPCFNLSSGTVLTTTT